MPHLPSSPRLRHALVLGLALCCTTLEAAPAKTPVKGKADGAAVKSQGEDAELLKWLHHWVELSFALDKDLPLDPALRAGANALRETHLKQVRPLLAAWMAEERVQQRAAGAAGTAASLYFPLMSRLFNELALWQLDTGDAAYEAATLAVLKAEPRVCVTDGGWRFGDFARRITRIQAMPVAQREAALANEGRMLARWGQARPVQLPMPLPLPQEAVALAISRWQAGGPRPALALTPALADSVLSKRLAYDKLHKDEQCALQQWWLQLSLLQDVAPAHALRAYRYGTMSVAADRYDDFRSMQSAEKSSSARPYPPLAMRFEVTGTTTVRVRLDGNGLVQEASIIGRKIEVPGIRDAYPVAFEQVFDAAALAHAMSGLSFAPSKTGYTNFQMAWKLEDRHDTADGEEGTP